MKTIAATALFVVIAAGAQAQNWQGVAAGAKPYVGLDLTQTWVDYETITPGVGGDDVLEDSLLGLSPYIGAQLNDIWAVELGYTRTEDGEKSNVLGTAVDTEVSMQGVTLDVVARLPLDIHPQLAVLGTAGIGYYEADLKFRGAGGVASTDDSEWAPRVGFGAQYQLTEQWGLRGMVRYVGTDFGDSVDHMSTASVGLNYKF